MKFFCRFPRLLACVLVELSISSCSHPVQSLPLPAGIQVATGILVPVPLSRSRRGTHVLTDQHLQIYYVESSKLTLRQYEGRVITIRGTLSGNVDPRDLPVLTAIEVVSGELTVKAVDIPSLKLNVSVPQEWQGHTGSGGMRFTIPGNERPILSIVRSAVEKLPVGEMMIVGGMRAVRMQLDPSDQIVYIDHHNTIVSFAYTPPTGSGSSLDSSSPFYRILRSVVFEGDPPPGTGSGITSGSGTLSRQPCGGAAGILCPEGEYCAVSDATSNIGQCLSLQ